jgi:hypothetical protein
MNKIKKIMVLGLLLGGIVAPIKAEEKMESLLGVRTTPEGIEFQVASGGCTAKEHFSVLVPEPRPDAIAPMRLRLIRNRPDFCEANIPYGIIIKFTYEELGLGSRTIYTIANPVLPVFYVH